MSSQALLDALDPDGSVYAVLDGARDSSIVPWLVATRAPAWCLYAGKLSPDPQAAAPWLLRVGRGHACAETCW